MKSFSFVLICLFFGGVFFWTPTLVLLPPTTPESTFWLTASWTSPLVLLIFIGAAIWYRKGCVGCPSTCLFSLMGVWLTGPWFMALAAALRTPEAVRGMTVGDYAQLGLMSVFPPYTLYLSAAQGSAYALALATLLMLVCHHVLESDRWFIPPEWKRRIHIRRSHPKTYPNSGNVPSGS